MTLHLERLPAPAGNSSSAADRAGAHIGLSRGPTFGRCRRPRLPGARALADRLAGRFAGGRSGRICTGARLRVRASADAELGRRPHAPLSRAGDFRGALVWVRPGGFARSATLPRVVRAEIFLGARARVRACVIVGFRESVVIGVGSRHGGEFKITGFYCDG